MIASIDKNLSSALRAKILYHAFDADQRYLREAEETANSAGFAHVATDVGELVRLGRILASDLRFDFITFTNTVHEVSPGVLAKVLVECVSRLTDRGCLFIYDMETVNPPELGAIPWTSTEFAEIVNALLGALGVNSYEPGVGHWQHSSTEGWNVQIHRHYLGVGATTILNACDSATAAVTRTMSELLNRKLLACEASLESLTRFGAETPAEEDAKSRLLHTYWSLSRARRGE